LKLKYHAAEAGGICVFTQSRPGVSESLSSVLI